MADMEPPYKRSRADEDRVAIIDLLACVGDRGATSDVVASQISGVVSALEARLSDPNTGREALEMIGLGLLRCGLELPFKSGVYATILGLLASDAAHTNAPELAQRLGAGVLHELTTNLRDGHSPWARRSMRYLAELARAAVIAPRSLIAVLTALLDAADGELSQPSRGAHNVHARGQFLADVALSCLPWCGAFLAEKAPEEFEAVVRLVQSVCLAFTPNRWRAIAVGDAALAAEAFAELVLATEDLMDSGWEVNLDVVPAYYAEFQERLENGPRTDLDAFALPAHSKLTRYSPPRFRVCLLSKPEERAAATVDADGASDGKHGSGDAKDGAGDAKDGAGDAKDDAGDAKDDVGDANDVKLDNGGDAKVDDGDAEVEDAGAGENGVAKQEKAKEDDSAEVKVKIEKDDSKKDDSSKMDDIDAKSDDGEKAEDDKKVDDDAKPDKDGKGGEDSKVDSDANRMDMTEGGEAAVKAVGTEGSKPDAEAQDKNGANGAGKEKDSDVAANGSDKEDEPMQDKVKKKKQVPLDRYVLRLYVADVLDNFLEDHARGADRLLTVSMLLGANDVIVETLFSEMCATPTPTNPAIYYGTVFVDLCQVKDSRLPIKLLIAVERMFQDAGSLDQEVFDRLTEWFSFHISNFGYKWNWPDWAVYADADMVEKFPFRALFCRDVLDRIVRLSYHDRINKIVPEEMRYFMPQKLGTGDPVRFDSEMTTKILKIVSGEGKQSPDIVEQRLSEFIPSSDFDGNESEANMSRLVALMRAILQGSARALSHFDTLTERYLELLTSLAATGGVAARKAIAFESGVFWSGSHIRRLYVLDKLSTYRLIDGLAILDFIHSPVGVDKEGNIVDLPALELCARLEHSPVWELTRLVFARARSRLAGARSEVTAASGAASHATEGDADEAQARLTRAKAGAQNAKGELRELVLFGLRRLFMLADMIFTAQKEKEAQPPSEDIMDVKDDNEKRATGGHVFSWRVLGMIREMGRKHPEQMENLLGDVRDETSEARERHPYLKEAFEVLEEIAGCDIAC